MCSRPVQPVWCFYGLPVRGRNDVAPVINGNLEMPSANRILFMEHCAALYTPLLRHGLITVTVCTHTATSLLASGSSVFRIVQLELF